MKQRAFVVIVAVLILSTMACSLTGSGTEKEEEPAVAATQALPEVGEEQPAPPAQPPQDDQGGEAGNVEATQVVLEPGEGLPDINLQDIPEGYPETEIPIYNLSESDILGGFRQDMGDITMYTLVIGSDDDVETVTQKIRDTFESTSTEFEEMLGGGTFMGVKDGWEYVIVINSGEADGYATLITYTLSMAK